LIVANRELAYENREKEKRAAELVIANEELAFQNAEKEKRAAELIIANRELYLENKEKEKLARELITANKELVFRNDQKEQRAAELILANQKLSSEYDDKRERAAELARANEELIFQHSEKEKRAAELAIANKELVFQNAEKEKRASELVTANHELKVAETRIVELNIGLEQKVIERTAQLEAVNKELEAFSYSVSHDLRAPLRGIGGYAQMLEEDYFALFDENGKRMLKLVQESSRLMGRLIDDLLAFSKLGRKEILKSKISMTELAEMVVEEIKTTRTVGEIRIHALHGAWGDRSLIKQVLYNYISNAVKYSSKVERPKIEIKSVLFGNEIIYSVIDNGAGFDMTYLHKLFRVFQRLHTVEQFEGTGVGLAIVGRIVGKHGGRTWAEGAVDKGATFFFSLPVMPGQ
jgi:signal transduction histidine kinase